MDQRCEICDFYDEAAQQCRRHPPMYVLEDTEGNEPHWPGVAAKEDYCGEHSELRRQFENHLIDALVFIADTNLAKR